MLKNRYAYPAIFSYDDDGISIEFPDLPGCCPYADKDDTDMAIRNAREALGLHMWGIEDGNEEIPHPSDIGALHFEKNQIPVLIEVFMPPVHERVNSSFVKKQFHFPRSLQPRQMRTGLTVQNCFSRC